LLIDFGLTIGLFGNLIFGQGWMALLNIPLVVSMLVGFLAMIRLHDRFASKKNNKKNNNESPSSSSVGNRGQSSQLADMYM